MSARDTTRLCHRSAGQGRRAATHARGTRLGRWRRRSSVDAAALL